MPPTKKKLSLRCSTDVYHVTSDFYYKYTSTKPTYSYVSIKRTVLLNDLFENFPKDFY